MYNVSTPTDPNPDFPPHAAPLSTQSELKLDIPPHMTPLPMPPEHKPDSSLHTALLNSVAADIDFEAAAADLSETS